MRIKTNYSFLVIISFLFQTHLFGQADSKWKEISLPAFTSKYSFIDFSDSLHGILCTQNGKFITTEDGGFTWRKDSLSEDAGTVGYVKMTDSGLGWIFVEESLGQSVKGYHRDADGIWRKKFTMDTTNISVDRGIAVTNDSTFFVLSRGTGSPNIPNFYVYKISGYGGTKEIVNFDFTSGIRGMVSITFADEKKGWIMSGGATSSSVAQTADGGVTWEWTRKYDYNIISSRMKFFTPDIGYTITTYYYPDFYVYRSVLFATEGGKTASVVYNGEISDGVYYSPTNYAIIYAYERLTKDSSNTFFTWQQISPTDKNYYATPYRVESTDPRTIWVLTYENKLFKRYFSTTSVEAQPTIQASQSYILSNNYPNPFNPVTTFSLTLKTRNRVMISVYNTLGEKITELANNMLEAGLHQITWDARSQPSGVYVVHFIVGANHISKPILLLK